MGEDGNITVVGTELTLDGLLEQLSQRVSFVAEKIILPSGEPVVLLKSKDI